MLPVMNPCPKRFGIASVLALAIALMLSCAAGAQAKPHPVESMFQDDNYLLYAPTSTVQSTVQTLKGLGVQRLRVTVVWSVIAPDSTSTKVPKHFDATNPADYPASGWAPYDRIVQLAATMHIGVDFDVTEPGPLWAMAKGSPVARYANRYYANATDWGQFVEAVGKRYSGKYVLSGFSTPLPRVNYWSIWNEPNQPGWLFPQWSGPSKARVMQAVKLYRSYLDQAYKMLVKTGHKSDTITIGELAPEGTEGTATKDPIPALEFFRGLYCVGTGYKPLSGHAASVISCPTKGPRSAFVKAHPGLFTATGFADHPYSFFAPPSKSLSDPNDIPISDLGRLEHALDTTFATYGVHTKLPLYLTEYGYETNPPNPYCGVALATQAAYIDQAQYMAWQNPRVRTLAQFELYDSPPETQYPVGSVSYWSSFQTGLLFVNGAPKPSFAAYRLPLWIPQPKFAAGKSVYVWGMLRPAPRGRAKLQWAPPHGSYRTLATITSDSAGALAAHVKPPGTGTIQIAWTSPGGTVDYSRAAAVTQG
jgi:hypothetical protein